MTEEAVSNIDTLIELTADVIPLPLEHRQLCLTCAHAGAWSNAV
ncbi:hypothetical protein [Mesorhizobium onobrychidis]|nr:hypothetical protein [Mesorhizobium onobrychidis]